MKRESREPRRALLFRTLRLAVARAALTQGSIKEARRISQRNPALAIRRAAVGFPFDTLVDSDDVAGARATNFHHSAHQQATVPIKRQQIGHAKALAGNHQNAAALYGGIGDQRIADNDRCDAVGQIKKMGLVDIDTDDLVGAACRCLCPKPCSQKCQDPR